MNDPIFSQMKEQLIPSPAARAALGSPGLSAVPSTGAGAGCWPPASFWRPPCR